MSDQPPSMPQPPLPSLQEGDGFSESAKKLTKNDWTRVQFDLRVLLTAIILNTLLFKNGSRYISPVILCIIALLLCTAGYVLVAMKWHQPQVLRIKRMVIDMVLTNLILAGILFAVPRNMLMLFLLPINLIAGPLGLFLSLHLAPPPRLYNTPEPRQPMPPAPMM